MQRHHASLSLPLLELAARRAAEAEERAKAEEALRRRRERQRVKSLSRKMDFAAEERRTAELLAEEEAVKKRVQADPQLDAFLAARQAGKSMAEALREAEGLTARPASNGNGRRDDGHNGDDRDGR